jgi:hypothetical protein
MTTDLRGFNNYAGYIDYAIITGKPVSFYRMIYDFVSFALDQLVSVIILNSKTIKQSDIDMIECLIKFKLQIKNKVYDEQF